MSRKLFSDLCLILGFAEMISALLAICAPPLPGIISHLLPGALFGAMLSVFLWWRKIVCPLWKMLAIVVASSIAFPVSALVALCLEYLFPYPLHEIGKHFSVMSNTALFMGGTVGAFLILFAVLLLVGSETAWRKVLITALSWSSVGGVLGIVGWSLGPWLGKVLWSLQHDLGLTLSGDRFEYALAQGTAATVSLLLIWMTGMGFLLGLVLDGLQLATSDGLEHLESRG